MVTRGRGSVVPGPPRGRLAAVWEPLPLPGGGAVRDVSGGLGVVGLRTERAPGDPQTPLRSGLPGAMAHCLISYHNAAHGMVMLAGAGGCTHLLW